MPKEAVEVSAEDVGKFIAKLKEVKREVKKVMEVNTKYLVFGLCVVFVLLCAFVGMASAKTIYVPDDYAKIQWAVGKCGVRGS